MRLMICTLFSHVTNKIPVKQYIKHNIFPIYNMLGRCHEMALRADKFTHSKGD